MSSTMAFVEHPVTKHCSILTAGNVSPKALFDLVDTHNEYFIVKDIDDKDKVHKENSGRIQGCPRLRLDC